ncbi:MAG: acyltransferase [Pseudomonadota bacterium]
MASFWGVIFKNLSLAQALRSELEEDLGFLVRPWPGILGFVLRYLVYKPLLARLEGMPYIYPGVRLVHLGRISLGKGVLINSNTYVYGKGGLTIGDHTLISPNCAIVAGDHDFSRGLIMEQPSLNQRIAIGRDCWIGANAVVVGGVSIGDGAVVGAGAVVTGDLEPYSINVGVPARKVGQRPRATLTEQRP